MLAAVLLALTALAAGLTGSWSPCGFSMLCTLGPTGHTGGRRTTFASCAAFALGALGGGAATFTALSYLGRLLGGGGSGAALFAAIVVAVVAGFGEARGVRILPQVRRQVPEHWRRVMPLPLAGGLYGILLGLGFTTFVLTLAVWALAGLCVALADPLVGLPVGLAFGVGRALPVVALAPWIDGERGLHYAELMAQRPVLLRGLRLLDGVLLLLSAAALAGGTALAAPDGIPFTIAAAATDPTVSGATVAWAVPGAPGMLRAAPDAAPRALGGSDPALGGPNLATRVGDDVTVTASGVPVARVTIPGVRQLAVSSDWLVARSIDGAGRTVLSALRLPAMRPVLQLAVERSAGDVGRPSIDGDRVVAAVNRRRDSRILEFDLSTGRRRVLRASRTTQLLNPALFGNRLLYVESTYCDQRLQLGSVRKPAAVATLLRIGGLAVRDAGHEPGRTSHGSEPSRCPGPALAPTAVSLWATALALDRVYVTELTPQPSGPPLASLVAVALG